MSVSVASRSLPTAPSRRAHPGVLQVLAAFVLALLVPVAGQQPQPDGGGAGACALSGQAATISVTRNGLRSTTATVSPGVPSGSTFVYGAALLTGTNVAVYSTSDAAGHPSTGTIAAPANPEAAPSPGGLAQLSVALTCEGGRISKPFHVATFGLSCYILAAETDFIDASGQCTALTIGGTKYSGETTNPAGLTGTFCTAFLHDVILQGSGTARDGTKVHYDGGGHEAPRFSVIANFTGADNTPLVPFKSVARDPSIVPRNTTIQLESGSYAANDTGGAIKGYRLDVFGGSGRAVCARFQNAIELGVCDTNAETCPGPSIP